MRVGLVTSIPRGGPVEHALLLARDLVRLGVEVSALAAAAEVAERFTALGARAWVLPLRPGADVGGARRLQRRLRGTDVVHTHDRRSGLWVRLLPRPDARTALIHTLHGLPEPYLPPPVGPPRPGARALVAYRGLERVLAWRSDALVVPSEAAAQLAAQRLGYRPGRLTVVPNGVEFPLEPLMRAGAVVGTISLLEPVKGLDVFLRAVAELAHERPATRFVVFGSGSQAVALRELAIELGLAARVEFPGYVPAAEALPQLGVFVLPSHMETSGLALLEALAAGVPAVATRVGGIPETAPGDAAELVPPGDPSALAAAIARLLDDPALAERRIAAGRAAAAERTSERTAARLLEVYKAARARRAGRRPPFLLNTSALRGDISAPLERGRPDPL